MTQRTRRMRTAARVLRYLLLTALGVLAWLFGLYALNVPPDLPTWRQVAGGTLLAGGALCLAKAYRTPGGCTDEG